MVLTEDETITLPRELDNLIGGDKFFLSPRIQTLKAIHAKIRPEPERAPPPPLKHYDLPRVGARRRRG